MKDGCFKGFQRIKIFVYGPLDPIHNLLKFYCMLCKTNVSIYSEGTRDLLRHYKSEGYLKEDRKWRYVHLQETDDVTGIVPHFVRRNDGTP